jgi:hypothetical protein
MGSVAHPILVDRIVYATITIMSVLIIYDGWQHLKSLDVIGVIVGPVIAMFLAHLFSASLAKQVEAARALTWDDRATIVRSESRFLLLCAPPVGIVCIVFAFDTLLNDAIVVTLWLETLSLGYWGYLAARHAGVVGWRRPDSHCGRIRARCHRSAAPGCVPARESVLRGPSRSGDPLRPGINSIEDPSNTVHARSGGVM